MPKEELAKDEVLVVELIELVLSNGELALALSLEQVLRGRNLENGVTSSRLTAGDLEAYGLQVLLEAFTALKALTEVGVALAVQVLHSFFPLRSKALEQGRRDSDQS